MLKQQLKLQNQFISTGSLLLDINLFGGFPIGKVIKLEGESNIGKSNLIKWAMWYVTVIMKKRVYVVETENKWSLEDIIQRGIDHTLVDFCPSSTVEQSYDAIRDACKSQEYALVAYDSFANNASEDTESKTSDENTIMADKSKGFSTFWQRYSSAQNQLIQQGITPPTLIFTNQVREKPNSRGFRITYTPGGTQQNNSASLILRMMHVEELNDEKESDPKFGGVTLSANVTKWIYPTSQTLIGRVDADFYGHVKSEFLWGRELLQAMQHYYPDAVRIKGTWITVNLSGEALPLEDKVAKSKKSKKTAQEVKEELEEEDLSEIGFTPDGCIKGQGRYKTYALLMQKEVREGLLTLIKYAAYERDGIELVFTPEHFEACLDQSSYKSAIQKYKSEKLEESENVSPEEQEVVAKSGKKPRKKSRSKA